MDYGFIYITTNIVNGKRYLGKCKSSRPGSSTYLGSGKRLKQAIAKYGSNNFTREIISYAKDTNDLWEQEYFFLIFFDCVNSQHWYNMAWQNTRGFSDKKHNADTKSKMKANYKRPIYTSTRDKLRAAALKNKPYLKAAEKRKEITGDNHHRSMPVIVDGVKYSTLTEAAKHTKFGYYKLRKFAISQYEHL